MFADLLANGTPGALAAPFSLDRFTSGALIDEHGAAAVAHDRCGGLMQARTVRRIALSLPESEERETWETATFRVRNKIFVMFSDRERELWVSRTSTSSAPSPRRTPRRSSSRPTSVRAGGSGVRIRTVDRDELSELVTEAWRLTAPKRLVSAFDEGAVLTCC